MDLAALQGRALARAVDDLRALLASGEVGSASMRLLSAPANADLWLEDGARLVATSQLVALANALPNYTEALPAVFSLVPELRAAWRQIVLARLREIGDRNDVAALCEAVTMSGALAPELVEGVVPTLEASPFAELERLVLPAIAHQAQAFPVLLRALAATAQLVKTPNASRVSVGDVVWDDPSRTWQSGRLIRLPSFVDPAPASSVLTGSLDDSVGDGDAMRWVLQRPWAFLLGQMVFTKEAWEAERVSGSLAFELEQAHVALFQSPPRVHVVVTLPTGIVLPDGVLCNSGDRYVREYIMGTKDEASGEFHGGKAIVKGVISLPADAFKLSGTGAKTSVLYVQKRHARKDDPEKFQDEPQTDVFMAVAETLGYVVKNNVEDYSAGVPNDLAAIVGAYVRGE